MPISFFWDPIRLNNCSNSSQISLQFGWLVNNGIFNKPIIAHTQILVHRWGPRTRVLALFHRCTNTKSLGSFVAQAILCQAFTHFFHFSLVNIIEQSPIAKKIWLSIHPRNFGNHVTIGPLICPFICPGSTPSEFLCNGYAPINVKPAGGGGGGEQGIGGGFDCGCCP